MPVDIRHDDAPPKALQVPIEVAFRVIRRAGVVVLAAAVVGGISGFTLASMNPPLYESIATLIVTRPPTDTRAAPVPAFRALLETNTMALAAIARFHLDKPPYEIDPVDFRGGAMVLEEVRNTNMIRVHARLPDPQAAAQLADYFATRGVELSEDINNQQLIEYRAQLKGMVDDATKRMKQAESQLLEFRKTAQIDVTKKDADAALGQRGQLLALTVDIESEKARLAKAETEIKGQQPYVAAPRHVATEAALRSLNPRSTDAFTTNSTSSPLDSGGTEKDKDKKKGTDTDKTKDKDKDKPKPDGAVADWEKPGADPDQAGLDLTNPYTNPVYQVLQYQISLSRTRLAALEARRQQLVGAQGLGGRELSSLGSLYPKEVEQQRLENEFDLTKSVYSEVSLAYERARLQGAGMSARLQLIDPAIASSQALPRHRLLYALVLAVTFGAAALIALAALEFLRAR